MAEIAIGYFNNPFHMQDLCVFDNDTWQHLLMYDDANLTPELLANALHGSPACLNAKVTGNLSPTQYKRFIAQSARSVSPQTIACARRKILDYLFWELIYWRMPEEYEKLTAGEYMHPAIFQQLASDLQGKTILDVGAGSGRATFASLRAGAAHIYAVEPSPGLLHILQKKMCKQQVEQQITLQSGRFDALPLADASVDLALSCSAFTSHPEQGGEPGLRELRRVVRPGGKIVVIWPRPEDYSWLYAHDFSFASFPTQTEMALHFHSLASAIHCAQLFYKRKPAALHYILATRRPEIPFSVIDVNPPCDYFWLNTKGV